MVPRSHILITYLYMYKEKPFVWKFYKYQKLKKKIHLKHQESYPTDLQCKGLGTFYDTLYIFRYFLKIIGGSSSSSTMEMIY